MSNLAGTVKQIALDIDEETVIIELICRDNYGAQVLKDDLESRMRIDQVFSLICKVGAEVASS